MQKILIILVLFGLLPVALWWIMEFLVKFAFIFPFYQNKTSKKIGNHGCM